MCACSLTPNVYDYDAFPTAQNGANLGGVINIPIKSYLCPSDPTANNGLGYGGWATVASYNYNGMIFQADWVARLPNREIALGIAQVVQRRLGLDLGLPRDQPLPPLHSRQAAEVARRVLVWAAHQDAAAGQTSAVRGDEAGWKALPELEDTP